MPLIQLIVLALIQGITEFLPISSSAHLILAPLVMDWRDQGPLIDLAAHVGTLGAVMLYFRRETGMLVRGGVDTLRFRESSDRRLFLLLAGASVPIVLFGALLVALKLESAMRSPHIIGATSIVFGLFLWHADRRPAAGEKTVSKLSWREAMMVGLAQMLSLVPGVSRSGVTMTAARYLGWSRVEAARFSMLLAIPVTMVLGLAAMLRLVMDGGEEQLAAGLIVAGLSFLVALGAIAFLMKWLQRMSFLPFVVYRVLLGAALLWFAEKLA
ncbi:MAG: undecaprenyl-diphosphate phosphatase [Amphiplicatus sp.]